MKCLYKILSLTLLTSSLYARDIILVENQAGPEEGKLLMKILQEKFNVPAKLITYRTPENGCAKKSEAIMQLCMKKDGELEIVKINRLVIERAFGVFRETEEL